MIAISEVQFLKQREAIKKKRISSIQECIGSDFQYSQLAKVGYDFNIMWCPVGNLSSILFIWILPIAPLVYAISEAIDRNLLQIWQLCRHHIHSIVFSQTIHHEFTYRDVCLLYLL